MFLSAAQSPVNTASAASADLWDLDTGLLPLLRAIVSAAADTGSGACLVILTSSGERRRLVSVRCERHRWRELADAAMESGEPVVSEGVIAAPLRAPRPLSGALLLSHNNGSTIPHVKHLAAAFTAQLEAAVATSAAAMAATRGAVDALLYALSAHDPETARHTHLVRRLAIALGTAGGLEPHALIQLEWTALLHDVGKIGIPKRLLQKSGPLRAAEWALMRMHPVTGERIVRAVPSLDAVGRIVRHHHEQWDGAGYPDRLSGTAIPLGARLVAMADAYETMRTGRAYRAPLSRDEALAELRRAAGSQFDPALVPLLSALANLEIDP